MQQVNVGLLALVFISVCVNLTCCI